MAERLVGIIGGSGLYEMDGLEGVREERIQTPFGEPSDRYLVGRLEGRPVAFLARHGQRHSVMPSELNFRANIYGFKVLGAEWILSASAVGSMKQEVKSLDILITDQFFDLTYGRIGTFFGNGLIAHVMRDVFAEWNRGELDSYLVEITRDILGFKDEDGQPLVDRILDTAGQKGTGKWTGIEALELGIPLTLIGEAVFARCLSAIKEERVAASKVLPGPKPRFEGDRKAFVEDLRKALYASKIVSYAQGYTLMRAAAKERGWNLNYGGVALMWRGGCIIRSVFLGKIKEAFDKDPGLTNLLLDPFFRDKVVSSQDAWRRVVASAVMNGVPVPAFATALNYFDGFRAGRLPANLLQAQRDYFGAHTYERTDKPRGQFFHTNWTGRGGTTSASTYSVERTPFPRAGRRRRPGQSLLRDEAVRGRVATAGDLVAMVDRGHHDLGRGCYST